MHYAYNLLNTGERTSFYSYLDDVGKKGKIFSYIKSFNISPQRIEFDLTTFQENKDIINNIVDLIHYLTICQGDKNNPQIRPIAIAEKFARSTIKLYDIYNLMKNLGLISTINQERFG
jgi:hypothetical protein